MFVVRMKIVVSGRVRCFFLGLVGYGGMCCFWLKVLLVDCGEFMFGGWVGSIR